MEFIVLLSFVFLDVDFHEAEITESVSVHQLLSTQYPLSTTLHNEVPKYYVGSGIPTALPLPYRHHDAMYSAIIGPLL